MFDDISNKSDFGAYLQTVEERDIDLLLMEEFHVSADFVSWFCAKVGLHDVEFSGAWHSISDEDGETDLPLRVRVGDQRVGVLIENKIAAPEQLDQDARYHLRGNRSREAGRFDRFVTCICGPEAYLAGLAITSQYQHRIGYELFRDWYAHQQGSRSEWRRKIMDEAIQQGRRGYVMVVNSMKSEFHGAYWEYLRRRHPSIIMRKPTPKGRFSDWIYLRSLDMPKDVRIVHKNDQGCVELTFERTDVAKLLAAKNDWPEDVFITQKGRSAVLGIGVSKMNMALDIASQNALIEEALAAAYRLIPFCRVLQNGA